jgi:hypothetical protein
MATPHGEGGTAALDRWRTVQAQVDSRRSPALSALLQRLESEQHSSGRSAPLLLSPGLVPGEGGEGDGDGSAAADVLHQHRSALMGLTLDELEDVAMREGVPARHVAAARSTAEVGRVGLVLAVSRGEQAAYSISSYYKKHTVGDKDGEGVLAVAKEPALIERYRRDRERAPALPKRSLPFEQEAAAMLANCIIRVRAQRQLAVAATVAVEAAQATQTSAAAPSPAAAPSSATTKPGLAIKEFSENGASGSGSGSHRSGAGCQGSQPRKKRSLSCCGARPSPPPPAAVAAAAAGAGAAAGARGDGPPPPAVPLAVPQQVLMMEEEGGRAPAPPLPLPLPLSLATTHAHRSSFGAHVHHGSCTRVPLVISSCTVITSYQCDYLG